jgi:hypothetical protein
MADKTGTSKTATKKAPARDKKLIILGTATNRDQAPFDDENVVIWGTGGTVNAPGIKRVDAIFELHPERYWKRPEVLEILSKYKGHILMQDHYDEIPNSVRYPIEKVREEFYIPTMGPCLYVTNTVAYMFMMAYLEGFREIDTYGVYMEHETEYDHQRTNCEYYVGYLTAKGVKITFHGGEVLKARFEYGFQEPPFVSKLVSDGSALANAKKDLEEQIEKQKRDLYMQEGAIAYNKDLRRAFGGY